MAANYLSVIRPERPAWDKGRIIGQKRPLLPKHVWSIRVRLEMADNRRDLALFNMAVDSKLRGCDLVCLKVRGVFAAGRVKERASVTQSKTGKPVRFEITETTRQSLGRWIADPEMLGLEYLWPSRLHHSAHLSTRQYARILRDWVTSIGLEPSAYGTHSMRRTKVSQIYKKTGNLRAVQLLLGHTKMDSTVRYLGVDLDDALTLSEGIDLYSGSRSTDFLPSGPYPPLGPRSRRFAAFAKAAAWTRRSEILIGDVAARDNAEHQVSALIRRTNRLTDTLKRC